MDLLPPLCRRAIRDVPEALRHKLLDVVSARWDHPWTEDCLDDFWVRNGRMLPFAVDPRRGLCNPD